MGRRDLRPHPLEIRWGHMCRLQVEGAMHLEFDYPRLTVVTPNIIWGRLKASRGSISETYILMTA